MMVKRPLWNCALSSRLAPEIQTCVEIARGEPLSRTQADSPPTDRTFTNASVFMVVTRTNRTGVAGTGMTTVARRLCAHFNPDL